ncbi:hypothetical protein WH47_08192 [Habropoda laboriosa]|uniref:Uncharacterized protein n=1 Tax=Habropoda laboriosa TaxID=597456 RepID=A0A0L7RGW6_9HYME|nr:hypothetical protein WH47_08192 [Habropoda laboriosa]
MFDIDQNFKLAEVRVEFLANKSNRKLGIEAEMPGRIFGLRITWTFLENHLPYH